jgi:hypothetical protein
MRKKDDRLVQKAVIRDNPWLGTVKGVPALEMVFRRGPPGRQSALAVPGSHASAQGCAFRMAGLNIEAGAILLVRRGTRGH